MRKLCLIFVLLALSLHLHATGPNTTIVQDVVYRADGSAAHGSLVISWPGFTTAAGYAVAAGQMNLAIGSGGAISLALIPNEGAAPAGTFYRVLIKLDDQTQSTEFWVVPAASPTTVAAIRSTVMPAAVAAQFASRQYVDAAIAAAQSGNLKVINGIRFAGNSFSGGSTIQAAITDAGSTGAVIIPPNYAGADAFTNPNGIQI